MEFDRGRGSGAGFQATDPVTRPEVRIRKADHRDAADISAVVSDLTLRYIARGFSEQGRQRLARSMTPERIARHIDEGYLYLVAHLEHRIIGVAGIRACTHLYHLFVTESHQGRGIGTRLWHAARDRCCREGRQRVFTVNASLDARAFYEKLGFDAVAGPLNREGVIAIPMIVSVGA